MRGLLLSLIGLFILSSIAISQDEVGGYYFGPKLGPTIGMQSWDGFDRRPMLNYHVAVFIESIDPDFKGSLFAQLGYQARGSGLNIFRIGGSSNNQAFLFKNLSLMLAAKKRLLTNTLHTPYYFVGVRTEYQLSNNLADIQEIYSSPYYPVPEFVNSWTYGISFGGGIEFLGSDFIQPAIELNISPDLSFQYQSPEIPNVINPYNGQTTTLSQRKIRNITIEITFSLRFLRRIVYIN